jgi:hypothetical protein
MESDVPSRQFPNPPLNARHVFVVCRFDGPLDRGNPIDGFVLTRGYWSEEAAQAQAERRNAEVTNQARRYFVLPARISDGES